MFLVYSIGAIASLFFAWMSGPVQWVAYRSSFKGTSLSKETKDYLKIRNPAPPLITGGTIFWLFIFCLNIYFLVNELA